MTAATARVLNEAADHIDKVGLHKGWFFAGAAGLNDEEVLVKVAKELYADSPKCALGSIAFCSRTDAQFQDAASALEAILPPRYAGDVPDWNDVRSRRKGQVVAMLRRAAESVA